MIKILILSSLLLIFQCVKPYSRSRLLKRPPVEAAHANPIHKTLSTKQEAYQRKVTVALKQTQKPETYGSLWNSRTRHAYLFTGNQLPQIGQMIRIDLTETLDANTPRPETSATQVAKPKKPALPNDSIANKSDDPTQHAIDDVQKRIETLLETIAAQTTSLPSKDKLNYIYARIIETTPDGELRLRFERYSRTPSEEKLLTLTATTASDFIDKNRHVAAGHLQNIKLIQNINHEVKSLSSIGWTREIESVLRRFKGALTTQQIALHSQRQLVHDGKRLLARRLKKLRSQHRQLTKKQQQLESEQRLFQEKKDTQKEAKKEAVKTDETSPVATREKKQTD